MVPFEVLSMFKFLCRLGIHKPLTGHTYHFTDTVSGKSVYIAKCPCGREWLTDSPFSFFGFKIARKY